MHLKKPPDESVKTSSIPAVNGNAATESPFLFSLPFHSSFSLHHDPLSLSPTLSLPVQFISSLITPSAAASRLPFVWSPSSTGRRDPTITDN